jgi:hypothetical protein
MSIFARLFAAERGSIMVLAALSLTAVMGMSGLAVEVGTGYAAKTRNQRVADMAALGAALAYQANSSPNEAAQTAKDIVAASGLPVSAATVSFPATGVQVQVTTAVPVRLASLITNVASYNVSNSAIASLGTNKSPACVMALSSNATNGVGIKGNSTLNNPGCAVVSNSPVSVQGSSQLTATKITAPSIEATGSSTIKGTQATGSSASDPLSTNAALVAAFAKLGVTAPMNPPTFTVTSTNWSFPSSSSAYSALAATDPVKANCTLSGQIYSCNQGTYNINNLTVPSGYTVTFAGTSTISVVGALSANGATLNGSQATYNFKNSFGTGWSSSPTFGDIASLYVGGSVGYSGSGNVIGAGKVVINGTLSVGGASSLTIGAGTHIFGGISVSGSGLLTIGDGDLSIDGDVSTQGNSTINFGAGEHSIDGNVSIQGGGTMGAGLYLIDGNFDKNASQTVTATDVTIVASGSFSTGGSSGFILTAPGTGNSAHGAIPNIALASKTSLDSSIGGSSSNTIGGIIYLPNSNLSVSGAGSVAGTTCMAVVVNTLSITGSGGINNSNCTAAPLSSGSSVALIQ